MAPMLKIKHFLQSKLNTSKTPKTNRYVEYAPNDEWIAKYIPNINHKNSSDDKRRLVFISLVGLFLSWKKCPSHLLNSALCIVPLKREWIFQPLNHISELQSHLISIFGDPSEMSDFVELLKWKDSQKLVFWTLDNYSNRSKYSSKAVNPFWSFFSDKLSNLNDAITGKKYNPLHLDSQWWGDNYCSKTVKTGSILAELYFLTAKFETMKEIISQSNPELRPVLQYTEYEIPVQARNDLFDSDFELSMGESTEDWFISEDYDPYDIDTDAKLI